MSFPPVRGRRRYWNATARSAGCSFSAAGVRPIGSASSSGNWWEQHVAARWDAGWAQSWYKPYALAKWAYDDSTIEKWFGIGFIWFLLRLVLSIALALVDTVLTMGFFIGQFAFIIFGPTGRDVIYGFMILGVLILVIAGLADA